MLAKEKDALAKKCSISSLLLARTSSFPSSMNLPNGAGLPQCLAGTGIDIDDHYLPVGRVY